MRIEYPHSIGKEEAYKRIDNFLNQLQGKYKKDISDPQKSWNSAKDEMDFRITVKGFKVSGKVYVKDNQIALEGKLPWTARLFSGTIESRIRGQLETLFA